MTVDDYQLLTKAKQLDPAALQVLHRRFYPPVARYIQFKVGHPQTVEDLSGEVFVRVLEGLKKGQSWTDSPQAWIMGIARHVVTDYYRRRERISEVKLNDQLHAAADTDPLQHALRNDRQQYLLRAMQQLTGDQRDVVLMRFIEGMDIRSVAQALDKTPGAVKGLQYRALRALAEIMGDVSGKETSGVVQ